MSTILQQYQNRITNISNPLKTNVNALKLYFKNLINGNLIEAVNQIDNAVNAPSFNFYNIMGNSYFQKSDFINAAIAYQKSLEINSIQANIHYKLGIIHEIKGFKSILYRSNAT